MFLCLKIKTHPHQLNLTTELDHVVGLLGEQFERWKTGYLHGVHRVLSSVHFGNKLIFSAIANI